MLSWVSVFQGGDIIVVIVQRRNLVRLQELLIEDMSHSQFGVGVTSINFWFYFP